MNKFIERNMQIGKMKRTIIFRANIDIHVRGVGFGWVGGRQDRYPAPLHMRLLASRIYY